MWYIRAEIMNRCLAVAEIGDRLATIDMSKKWGLLCLLFRDGELGAHLTQCRLGRGQPPCQVASWSIQLFGHNRDGPKIGGGCVPLRRGAGSPSNTMWPGRGLPPRQVSSWSIQPFCHNTPTLQTWQTDNGPIAYGEPFYKRSPK